MKGLRGRPSPTGQFSKVHLLVATHGITVTACLLKPTKALSVSTVRREVTCPRCKEVKKLTLEVS